MVINQHDLSHAAFESEGAQIEKEGICQKA
jgi:hypothetical protein